MPAKSERQRKAACLALSAKLGKTDSNKLSGASKSMYDSMSQKELEKFCKTNVQEESIAMKIDKNILTEAQKKELRNIIDELVEERVQEKQNAFIKKYTKFIVESATSKVVDKMKSGIVLHIEEKVKEIQNKAEKACRSVLVESASKIQKIKQSHKKLIEEFKSSAPKIIEESVQKRVDELSEDARKAIDEKNTLAEAFDSFTKGLEKAGYVINEDIDGVIEKQKNENRMLKTKLIEARRNNKISQLTEGMLPGQKKRVVELLEDCVTEKQVEDRFLIVKAKILSEDRRVESEPIKELREKDNKLNKILAEENGFDELIGQAKAFIEKNI